MKRFGLIFTLFTVAFLLTQCSDDCGNRFTLKKDSQTQWIPIGIDRSFVEIEPQSSRLPSSDYSNIRIRHSFTLDYAKNSSDWSLIKGAYACSPPPEPIYDVSPFLDSIVVLANPKYRDKLNVTSFLITDNGQTLEGYNNSLEDIFLENRHTLFFLQGPSDSDYYTFSFYYYKEGAIIDSSATQKYFISN